MEHGIITLTEFVRVCASHLGDLLPFFWFDIGRDIHRTTIADYQYRFFAHLCKTTELILKGQLRLQNGTFTFVIKRTVRSQIVPAASTVKSRNLRDGEHLVPHPREVFDNLHQCRSLSSTRSSRQYDLLNLRHQSSMFNGQCSMVNV